MCERKISFLKGFTVDKTIISLLGLKKTETVHIHTRRTITHVHINIFGVIHMQTHIYSAQHKTTFSPQKFKQMPKCVGHLWKKCLLVIICLQKYCASYISTAEYNMAEVVSIRCAHIVSPSRFSPQSSGSSACYSLCAPSCLRVSIVKHQITWKNLNAKQVTCFREYPLRLLDIWSLALGNTHNDC